VVNYPYRFFALVEAELSIVNVASNISLRPKTNMVGLLLLTKLGHLRLYMETNDSRKYC